MSIYSNILSVLSYVNMVSWAVAAVGAFKFSRIFKSAVTSWRLISLGSFFVLGRELIKLLPAYSALDSVYILRYVVGLIGALLLFVGFLSLYSEVRK